jgi:hypothetical protein
MISQTLRMATIHNDNQGNDPGSPHPSARLPCNVSTDIRGWPIHYPGLHHYRYGGVASVSKTIQDTKFMGPDKSTCAST